MTLATATAPADEAGGRVARLEIALDNLDAILDPEARETARVAVQELLELYGEGLRRLSDGVVAQAGADALRAAAADDLVAHLLLLHDAHPDPVESRIMRALDEVRPYLESHGGNVELLDVTAGVAHLRMEGSCSGCPSSSVTLKLAIEQAIEKAAPDVERIEAEGASTPGPDTGGAAFIPLASLQRRGSVAAPPAVPAAPAWRSVGPLGDLREAGLGGRDVDERHLVFIPVDGQLYAYGRDCPSCGASLAGGALDGAALRCSGCGSLFDARRAGRSLDGSALHLDPFPLLIREDGTVAVALGALG
jgi:Fe-S cluster biogenesis protein NfuA/nitrite reductase/ring-hydroxylating ferredoxin subunit